MEELKIPNNNQTSSDYVSLLNEPAIHRIAGYMNVLSIIIIIIGVLLLVFGFLSLFSSSESIPQLKKIGWISILFQLPPIVLGAGNIFAGYYLKISGAKFQRFLYFKNIAELNTGLDFQKRFFFSILLIVIFTIISTIALFFLSFALMGVILGGSQLIN